MSESTKKHFYPHILRSSAHSAIGMCQDKMYWYLIPPENALTIEQLFIHVKLTFDVSVAVGDRVIKYISVGSTVPVSIYDDPTGFKKIDVNAIADPTTRKIDLRLNITSILNKSNAGYRDLLGTIAIGTPTYIGLKVGDGLRGGLSGTTIDLWKMDALYTIKKIP